MGSVSLHDAERIIEDRERIARNPLLRLIYDDIYDRLVRELPRERFPRLLEIGSGAGFFHEAAPWAVTSERVAVPGVDRVIDACRLGDQVPEESFDAIAAFDVFHHLPDPAGFLRGAQRALAPVGRIALVEPWATPVGQWFHRVLHDEPWIGDPEFWGVSGTGRMGGANGRLPTNVFRDGRERLAREAPGLEVVKIEPFHKWLYLLSGGLRFNTRIPAGVAKRLVSWDRRVRTGDRVAGLFALIVLERRAGG